MAHSSRHKQRGPFGGGSPLASVEDPLTHATSAALFPDDGLWEGPLNHRDSDSSDLYEARLTMTAANQSTLEMSDHTVVAPSRCGSRQGDRGADDTSQRGSSALSSIDDDGGIVVADQETELNGSRVNRGGRTFTPFSSSGETISTGHYPEIGASVGRTPATPLTSSLVPAPLRRRKGAIVTYETGRDERASTVSRGWAASFTRRKQSPKSARFEALVPPDESVIDYLITTIARWLERLRDRVLPRPAQQARGSKGPKHPQGGSSENRQEDGAGDGAFTDPRRRKEKCTAPIRQR
jgi:hypothetical protein